MRCLALCLAVPVLCGVGAIAARASVLFQDDFDDHVTGVPPAGWTEVYGHGSTILTREEAAAKGVEQYVTDSDYFGASGKSMYLLDTSPVEASGLSHGFPSTASVTMEYYVKPVNSGRPGAEIRLQNDTGVDRTLTWNETRFQIYSGGPGKIDLLPYTENEWYYVRRTADGTAGTGSFYIEQVSDPTNSAYLDLAPLTSDFNKVVIATSGMYPAEYYIDELRVVPEPGSLILLLSCASSVIAFAAARRRGKRCGARK